MRVFISYRRADLAGRASALVGRISDRLVARFGESNVFLDVDSIPAGEDFHHFIRDHVAQADVVLVIIGPNWLEQLKARADRTDDFVRVEVRTALDRRMTLIPVLVGGASMPGENDVPEGFQQLCRLNAAAVDSGRDFHAHATRLIQTIESLKITRSIRSGEFEAVQEIEGDGDILKYSIRRSGSQLLYSAVLDLWQVDDAFREFYLSLLSQSPFRAYVWETPPITKTSSNRPFEFVLLNAPTPSGLADRRTYSDYFDMNSGDNGVVAFDNLGRDALLVVPSPVDERVDYSTLATFLNNAPLPQQHALWRTVGKCAQQRLGEKPLWVSIAGGGIAWLHIRIDTRPKYYRYAPYRTAQ